MHLNSVKASTAFRLFPAHKKRRNMLFRSIGLSFQNPVPCFSDFFPPAAQVSISKGAEGRTRLIAISQRLKCPLELWSNQGIYVRGENRNNLKRDRAGIILQKEQ